MSHRRRLSRPRPRAALVHRRSLVALLVLVGAAASAASPAQASPLQGTGHLTWNDGYGAQDHSTVAGDLNGDGMDDLAFGKDTTVRLVFGTKSGIPGRDIDDTDSSGTYRLLLPEGPVANVEPIGDFDGDGHDDLLIVAGLKAYVFYGGPGVLEGVAPLTSTGRITTIGVAKALGGSDTAPQAIAIGDFDGNGRDDLAITRKEGAVAIVHGGPRTASIDGNSKNARTSLITSKSICTYSFLIIPSCGYPVVTASAVGDFNGDGRDDLAIDTGGSFDPKNPFKRWLLFGRTGTFSTPAATPASAMGLPLPVRDGTVPTGYSSMPKRIGDVNGDGRDDLAAVPWTLPGGVRGTRHVLGTSNPPATLDLATAPSIDVAGGTAGRAVADLDGDGRRELAVLGNLAPSPYPDEGDLRLVPVPAGAGVVDAADGTIVKGMPSGRFLGPGLTDFDGDGQTDLVLRRQEYRRYDDSTLHHRFFIATHGVDLVPPQLSAASIAPLEFLPADGADLSVTAEEPDTTLEISYGRREETPIATERRVVPRGERTVRFDGNAGGVKLPAGDYYATVVPIDAAGNRGEARWLYFTLLGDTDTESPFPQSLASFKVSGDAWLAGQDRVVLTSGLPGARGTAVFPPRTDFNGRTFEFEARMTGVTGGATTAGGGLTMAFVGAEPNGAGNFLGTGGQQLGYGGLHGFALALDGSKGPNDPSDNFVGWTAGPRGEGLNWLQTADPGVALRSGAWVKVKVVLANRRAQVFVNGQLRMDRSLMVSPESRLAFTGASDPGSDLTTEVRALRVG